MQSHNNFGGAYTREGAWCGNIFVCKVFRTCYLYLKKEEWNKTKKQRSCSKMPFYYLRANKTHDLFHNSIPLVSLRLKNTWGGALNLVDLLKIALLYIFFLYFYNGFIYLSIYVHPVIDLFLDSDSLYNCIPHFSSKCSG